MKSNSNMRMYILPNDELCIISGGFTLNDSSFPWGKVILMVINSWSSIKSGLQDGFTDGIQ